jgi:hypothetical protein
MRTQASPDLCAESKWLIGFNFNLQTLQVIWSFVCDDQRSDVFSLQDIISTKVAEALAPKLSGEERELLAKRYTASPEAYQHYLKGRYFWGRRTDEGLKN